jgi:hypothetical protein
VADTVGLMTDNDPTVRRAFEQDGALVINVEPLVSSGPDQQQSSFFQDWFRIIALAKIRALDLTQYSRIQFLDADVVVSAEDGLDHLFEYKPSIPLVIEGLGHDSPIRAGWFMAKPSASMFSDIQQTATRGEFSVERGWDNLGLPVDYTGWSKHDDNNAVGHIASWGFYGADLEQGMWIYSSRNDISHEQTVTHFYFEQAYFSTTIMRFLDKFRLIRHRSSWKFGTTQNCETKESSISTVR